MVVVVILGLLAALVVPNVFKRLFTAKKEIARVQLVQFKDAIDHYLLEHSAHPPTLDVLTVRDEYGSRDLDVPEIPLDPWDNEYVYAPPQGGSTELVLCSYGADGAPGGEGMDADIHWYPVRKD